MRSSRTACITTASSAAIGRTFRCDLVDLKRTEREIADRKTTVEKESKIIEAEEKVEHEQQRDVSRIPQDPGVYQLIDGKELRILKAADSKVRTDKRRAVLKAMSPIPMVTGKATVEVDGSHASYNVDSDTPEFYIQLSAEEQFGIIRLAPKENFRIAEKLTIIPVTKDVMEEPEEVEIFRKQLDPTTGSTRFGRRRRSNPVNTRWWNSLPVR